MKLLIEEQMSLDLHREAIRFENEPFEGFLKDENGNTYINEGWQKNSVVRALNIQVEDFGSVSEFLGVNIDPNNPSSNIETPLPEHLHKLQYWEQSMIKESNGNINPTLLRNLALLNDLRVTNLTLEELKALSKIDITKTNLNEVFEIAIAQPGYWGKKSKKKTEEVNQLLGENNWHTMFKFNNRLVGHSKFAIDYFENCYRYYFSSNRAHYDELNYLGENASNLYEHPDQMDLDFAQGYDPTSYYGRQTTYQFVLIKRLMLLEGIPFEGDAPIMIKGSSKTDARTGNISREGGPIGRLLHPGAIAVPLSMQSLIPKQETDFGLTWWERWEEDSSIFNDERFTPKLYGDQQSEPFSVEQGYHRCKCIVVRKNPDKKLTDELLESPNSALL